MFRRQRTRHAAAYERREDRRGRLGRRGPGARAPVGGRARPGRRGGARGGQGAERDGGGAEAQAPPPAGVAAPGGTPGGVPCGVLWGVGGARSPPIASVVVTAEASDREGGASAKKPNALV